MKQSNAKNVRAFLAAAFLFLTFLFVAGTIAGAVWFQRSNRALLRESEERSFQLRSAHDAMLAARRSAGRFAAERTRAASDRVMRDAIALREASDRIGMNLFERSPEYRAEVKKFQHYAENAVPAREKDSGRALTAERVSALFEAYSGALTGAEEALRRLDLLEKEDTAALVVRLQNTFWRMSIGLFLFFLLAFLFVVFGFAAVGRAMRLSLKSLSEGTRELRTGNLDYRFHEITPDEIGQIKYDFNIMARQLSIQSGTLRKANGELREQAEKLLAAHQHKDRFLSNMSHELRTPLNSIIGFSELIEERAGRLSTEKLQSYAKRVLLAAEHLLDLITSLLDLAKSGAGVLKPVFSDFDLSAAVRETETILAPLAEKKNLEVRLDLPDGLMVHADLRMVKQIFINLFGNAVKYTKQGSVSVTVRDDEKTVFLDVADTGIGIPDSERDQLFTDFHRVDNGPDFVVDGIGIGLALSRRLAAMHNGDITFVSEYGKGSTFTFRFPKDPH